MQEFVYQTAPVKVVFDNGSRHHVGAELDALGLQRVLVLSTPQQLEQVSDFAKSLGDRCAAIFGEATMHTPTDVTEKAMAVVKQHDIDGIVAFGGGSTIGLGKAIALRTDLPQIVLPTTYAGSEMTPILGQTEDGIKTTQSSPLIQPEVVIYDPELTLTLPAFIAGPSGMNAIAHSVEALYAENGNPVISLMAEESIRAIGRALPIVMSDTDVPQDQSVAARSDALYGAWLAGTCLGNVGMAVHHKICHTLGGSFDLPHADVHCLMIAYSTAYNSEAAPEAMAAITRALGVENAALGLYDLLQKVGQKKSLAELGMTEADLDKATEIALQKPYYNPRPITQEGIRGMLQQAWEGTPPHA